MVKTYSPIGVDLTATPDSIEHTLGDRVTAEDGQEYVYIQANGAITQYDFVGIDENYQAAALTKAMADDGYSIGVAQVAFADNDYGWVATRGHNLQGRVGASCAADAALWTSSTAGVLDDASASQTKIDGVVAVTAETGGAAAAEEVLLTWPKSATF